MVPLELSGSAFPFNGIGHRHRCLVMHLDKCMIKPALEITAGHSVTAHRHPSLNY